jgi:hypothetical protein
MIQTGPVAHMPPNAETLPSNDTSVVPAVEATMTVGVGETSVVNHEKPAPAHENASVLQLSGLPTPPIQEAGSVSVPAPSLLLKPQGDLHRLGIPVECLGMSLADPPKLDAKGDKTDGSKKQPPKGMQVQVHSLNSDGMLDMYTYHRGREGMEPRDPDSGELLCDVEPTDTNHDWDTPKLNATIVIEFPLEDESEYARTAARLEEKESETALYKETITWDLSDSNTTTPQVFARNLAEEFGLSFGQTMDLTLSIQQQLDAHVLQNCTYSAPVTLKDPSDNDRPITLPPRFAHRYGEATNMELAGIRLTKKELLQRQQKQLPIVLPPRQPVVVTAPVISAPTPRRKPELKEAPVVYAGEEVEEAYKKEVERRAKAASAIGIAKKCAEGGGIGQLDRKGDNHCHACRKKAPVCYVFACGQHTHAFCLMHCEARLSLNPDSGPMVCEYCPVCSFSCGCSKCLRRLDALAFEFKIQCEIQKSKVEETIFEDILTRPVSSVPSKTKGSTTASRKSDASESHPSTGAKIAKPSKKPSSGGSHDRKNRPIVPKPPLSDFPREVCGVQDLEPGTAHDYLTLYTADGAFPCDDYPDFTAPEARIPEKAKFVEGEVIEDGNVDCCHACKNHGNLLCCDFCPRAFHMDCILGDNQSPGKRWECHVCQKENEGSDDDLVDGKKYLELLCASYFDADVGSNKSLECIRILSMIYDMVQKLLDYDFGYMFREPVDCEAVVGYSDIVKHPMDLGSISAKLINGVYAEPLKSGQQSWDGVIAAVLKDIELVWHNCFTFNCEGSAVYRMAEVQCRFSRRICIRSFGQLLSDHVKAEVKRFLEARQKERGKVISPAPSEPSVSDPDKLVLAGRPKGKHKITVKLVKGGVTKPIAVLDPVTGRVMKIYSTMKAAGQAAQTLLGLGHSCEWPTINDLSVKAIVHRSTPDPNALLFGYRWVVLEELRSGNVTFPQISCELVEMSKNGSTYIFMSVDEALSFADLPKKLSLGKLRKELDELPDDGQWVEVAGMKWRRPLPGKIHNKEKAEQKYAEGSTGKKDGKADILDRPLASTSELASFQDAYFSEHTTVTKEDLVTGRKLIGFESLIAAFQDWVLTCDSSPAFPPDEARLVENFEKYYLDGDRNVDGVIWRSFDTCRKAKPDVSVAESPADKEGKTAGVPSTTINGTAGAVAFPTDQANKKLISEECETTGQVNEPVPMSDQTTQEITSIKTAPVAEANESAPILDQTMLDVPPSEQTEKCVPLKDPDPMLASTITPGSSSHRISIADSLVVKEAVESPINGKRKRLGPDIDCDDETTCAKHVSSGTPPNNEWIGPLEKQNGKSFPSDLFPEKHQGDDVRNGTETTAAAILNSSAL